MRPFTTSAAVAGLIVACVLVAGAFKGDGLPGSPASVSDLAQVSGETPFIGPCVDGGNCTWSYTCAAQGQNCYQGQQGLACTTSTPPLKGDPGTQTGGAQTICGNTQSPPCGVLTNTTCVTVKYTCQPGMAGCECIYTGGAGQNMGVQKICQWPA